MKPLKFTTLLLCVLAAMASASSMAGQPISESRLGPMTKAFVENQAFCAALLDGRAGVVLDAQSKSKTQDIEATAAFSALLREAGNDPVRAGLIPSVLRACVNKQK